jgi:DNA-binding transcriptional MerR regulator/roadblock/LC7 domain-containing protein
MYASYASKLNNYRNTISKRESALDIKTTSYNDAKKDAWDNLIKEDWNSCAVNMEYMVTTSEHIFEITKAYGETTKQILDDLEKVISELRNKEILVAYRDFVADFLLELGLRFKDWPNARGAIHRKIRHEAVNYREKDKEDISKLKDFLQEVGMSVEDVESMIRFKKRSNEEFHRGNKLKIKEVRNNFETLFPDCAIKVSFRKAYNTLDYWDV